MQSICASKEQKAHSSTQLKIRHPPPPTIFCLFSETFYKHEARLFVLSMSAIPEQCYSGSCVLPHGMCFTEKTLREVSCISRHGNSKHAYYHYGCLLYVMRSHLPYLMGMFRDINSIKMVGWC